MLNTVRRPNRQGFINRDNAETLNRYPSPVTLVLAVGVAGDSESASSQVSAIRIQFASGRWFSGATPAHYQRARTDSQRPTKHNKETGAYPRSEGELDLGSKQPTCVRRENIERL